MIHEKHKAFARAVVALAREHGMDNINLQFRFGFDVRCSEVGCSDPVSMTWHAGRHGDTSKLALESRAFESIDERAPTPPEVAP